MDKTASHETALVLEIPYIINDENVITGPGQEIKTVSILSEESPEEKAFPYLLPKGKLRYSYKAPQDISISLAWYFKERLLNFN